MAPTSSLGVSTLRHVTETLRTKSVGRGPGSHGAPHCQVLTAMRLSAAVQGAEVTGELLLRRW